MSDLHFSNKPEILRLHELETQERTKFCTEFAMTLNQLLPSSLLRTIKSSQILTKTLTICPDLYYTFVTINYCRRRLGEEYTYIAMYKSKHFEEEGVLLNPKTRTLMTVLELVSRHGVVPWLEKAWDRRPEGESSRGQLQRVKNWVVQYVGTGEQIMGNIQWIVLMTFMLSWSKRFSIIERLLGISYVYTYKNDQVQDISYRIEGYLILATLLIKFLKHIYYIYLQSKAARETKAQLKPSSEPASTNLPDSTRKEKTLCRICYDQMKERSATKCGHVFCWGCIIRTLQMSGECPVCRASCLPREVVQLRNY